MRRVRGFSLIEVLAAMVIFSAGAVVLFDWINQTAGRIGRLSEEQQRLFGDLIGLEYARSLNPMRQPAGDTVIDGVQVRWQAEPVGMETPVRFGAANGRYMVQLYNVRLTTQARKGAESSQQLVLAGWRERQEAGRNDGIDRLFDNQRAPEAPRAGNAPR